MTNCVYFDKNGTEIKAGNTIRYSNGTTAKVYKTKDGKLGTDATPYQWVKYGIANPGEYGILVFTPNETKSVEVVS